MKSNRSVLLTCCTFLLHTKVKLGHPCQSSTVPGISGIVNFSFFGWNRKKMEPEKILESVSEKIGNGKKSWNRYRKNLEKISEPVSKIFGEEKNVGSSLGNFLSLSQ